MVPTAANNRAPTPVIMAQTGHKSQATVYGYIRRGTVFHDNAADYLGRESG